MFELFTDDEEKEIMKYFEKVTSSNEPCGSCLESDLRKASRGMYLNKNDYDTKEKIYANIMEAHKKIIILLHITIR